jgi:gas vesicle protein
VKFLWGLLLGLGLGVLIGLLIAPQSGETTRAQLAEQGVMLRSGALSGTLSDELRSRAQEALVQGRDLYSRTKTELTDRYTKAKSGEL